MLWVWCKVWGYFSILRNCDDLEPVERRSGCSIQGSLMLREWYVNIVIGILLFFYSFIGHWDSRTLERHFLRWLIALECKSLSPSIDSRILKRSCRSCPLEFVISHATWTSLQRSSTAVTRQHLHTKINGRMYNLLTKLHWTTQQTCTLRKILKWIASSVKII